MFRRSALPAAASLAVVLLAATGCKYTHQKTVIIDGAKAVIMTANLTSRYYATSRDFLVIDTERADVSAITAVFDADFTATPSVLATGATWSGHPPMVRTEPQ